jgi:putative Mn2+ efflux pump MntP
MSIWELFLTAVALSMDAMAVAVSAGLSNAGGKGVKFREAGLMGLFFGVFQAVMPLLGYYIIPLLAMIFGSGVTRFVEGTDHWIAFVLLVFLGGKMIIEAVRAEEEAEPSNPFALGTLFVMAIATSIDALATGIVFRSFSFSTGKLLLAVGFVHSDTARRTRRQKTRRKVPQTCGDNRRDRPCLHRRKNSY